MLGLVDHHQLSTATAYEFQSWLLWGGGEVRLSKRNERACERNINGIQGPGQCLCLSSVSEVDIEGILRHCNVESVMKWAGGAFASHHAKIENRDVLYQQPTGIYIRTIA